MDKVSGRLTVFFEEPFWIGVFERISEGKLSVCKVTFGAEPKDYEVYDFVLRNYYRLKFRSCSQSETGTEKCGNRYRIPGSARSRNRL